MSLAAIVTSYNCNIKLWTDKTLSKIEVIGITLYCDAVIGTLSDKIQIVQLPHQFYIDGKGIQMEMSKDNQVHDLDEPTLTSEIAKQFESSPTLYVLINTHSFALIKSEQIFYWYDPNGVDDDQNEIRPSVCCFSCMSLLVGHILTLGPLLQSITFSVDFVKFING